MSDSGRVIALGFFDGVHLGHAELLNKTNARAAELGLKPAMLTFDTHPDTLVSGQAVPLINSSQDRAYIVQRYFGIDDVITLHFDEATMHMPWRAFIDMMAERYQAAHFVVGDDFHFGYRGEGNAERLRERCAELGIGCDVMPKVAIDGVTVSSTYIRTLIAEGNIEKANRYLGHPYLLTGNVQHGFKLGRQLGTPTINLRFEENVIVPRYGVYATKLRIFDEDRYYPAVTNIGVRPTVSGSSSVSVESYLLGFNRDVYGKRTVCELYAFIRPEMKFKNTDELGARIKLDASMVQKYLKQKI